MGYFPTQEEKEREYCKSEGKKMREKMLNLQVEKRENKRRERYDFFYYYYYY